MFSLYGKVYGGAIAEDTTVLRQVVKGGNLPEKEKRKTLKKIAQIEKAEEQKKKPAIDLRAMYGN